MFWMLQWFYANEDCRCRHPKYQNSEDQVTQSLVEVNISQVFDSQIDEKVLERCGPQGWVGDISGLLRK